MATLLTHPPETAETTKTLIELAGVEKVYRNGKLEYLALRGVDHAQRPALVLVATAHGPVGIRNRGERHARHGDENHQRRSDGEDPGPRPNLRPRAAAVATGPSDPDLDVHPYRPPRAWCSTMRVKLKSRRYGARRVVFLTSSPPRRRATGSPWVPTRAPANDDGGRAV